MSFTRVKPAGWAVNEVLTSAQQNQLDIDHAAAIDGTNGGTYTLAALLEFAGAGIQPDKLFFGQRALTSANSPYALDALGSDLVLLVDFSGGGGGQVNLPAPSAKRLVVIKDYKQNSAGNPITVHRNNVGDTIDGVTSDLTIQKNNACVWLYGVTGGWVTLGGN